MRQGTSFLTPRVVLCPLDLKKGGLAALHVSDTWWCGVK